MRRLTILLLVAGVFSRANATQAIANWDCVPFQVIDSSFSLGVVAFHEDGVEVAFYANGTLLERVTASTYNARTDVYEYWTVFDPAGYADGAVKLTALAMPGGSGNENRVLDTLILYANSGGTLTNTTVKWADCDNGSDASGDGSEGNPYQTLEKAYVEVGAGGTVYLKRGTAYHTSTLYANRNYGNWTTITCAPGLTADDVQIVGYNEAGNSGRFGENMVRWRNVSMYSDNKPGSGSILYLESTHRVWFDGSVMYDKRGMINGSGVCGGNAGYRSYLTDCFVHDVMGVQTYPLLRNIRISRIGSDIYRPGHNMLAANVWIDSIGIMAESTLAHPDFVQFYNPGDTVENIIIYNNRCYDMEAQGLFGQNCRDVAFVNLLLEKDPPDNYATSQWSGVWDHILLWHVTTVDQGILARAPATNTNMDLRNCNLTYFSAGAVATLAGGSYSHNHYKMKTWDQPAFFGTDVTSGSQGFVDYDTDDYRIADTSRCYRSGEYIPGVPADIDNVPYHPVMPNRGCFASGYVSGMTERALPSSRFDGPGRYYDCAGRSVRSDAVNAGVYIRVGNGMVRKAVILK